MRSKSFKSLVMKTHILSTVSTILLCIWCITITLDYMHLPVVEKLVATNECVRVWTPDPKKPLSCAQALEGKYEAVWVGQ